MTTTAIEATGLRIVRASRPILEVAHLAITRGERLAVVGGNGAGKTSLIEALALLATPDDGTVAIHDECPTGEAARVRLRRRMGFVATTPNLLDASVARNISLPLLLRGASRADAAHRARALASRLAIDSLLGRHAHTLSAGEAARVSLARALVASPEILYLDEPFATLDEPTRDAFVRDLAQVIPAETDTVVLVTHDRREAVGIATRVVVLDAGRIAETGSPPAILEHPSTLAAARWAGFENTLAGQVIAVRGSAANVEICAGVVIEGIGDVATRSNVHACFRAEAVSLAPPGSALEGSIRNHFQASVVQLSPLAAGSVLVTLAIAGHSSRVVASLTDESARALALEPGRTVVAQVKATAVHITS